LWLGFVLDRKMFDVAMCSKGQIFALVRLLNAKVFALFIWLTPGPGLFLKDFLG